MRSLTTLIGLLLCAALGVYAQNSTYKATYTNEWEYMDVLTKGSEQEPASFKAIRLWSAEKGFDLELIGPLGITAKQVQKTLAKADYYYRVAPMGGQLRITAKGSVSVEQVYELVSTLLIGDFAYKFYTYTSSARRITP